jgi:SAM-dependent methyltransferase
MSAPTKARQPAALSPFSPRHTAYVYDAAGHDYLAYADGDATQPFNFTSVYGFADREIWRRLDATMMRLAGEGRQSISILDAGCGPGTWLRRMALRARELGFAQVKAFGFDISPGMIALAKAGAARIGDQAIRMSFVVRDLTNGHAFGTAEFDICLCLYGVLNHLPVATHREVAAELCRVTRDSLFVTVRAVGSQPTIYIDRLDQAHSFYQDNDSDVMEVDLLNGDHVGFTSHLFSSGELQTLFRPYLSGTAMVGIDLFHGRFAADKRWNPAEIEGQEDFESDLDELEHRYASNPNFIDRAAHILLIGEC